MENTWERIKRRPGGHGKKENNLEENWEEDSEMERRKTCWRKLGGGQGRWTENTWERIGPRSEELGQKTFVHIFVYQ